MKKEVLVSVIVPVYKVENYLERCVDSIINQTYKNLEIILVDDGSPDKCPQMCDEYAKKDARVKVIHKPNGGLSDARNVGFENSNGTYAMFVDSDDYLELNTVEELYDNLIKTDSDISCGMYAYVYDNDPGPSITENKLTILTPDEIMLTYPHEMGVFYTVACCKLMKREVFGDVRFPKGRLHEDEFTTYRYMCNAKKVVMTNDTLYRYYQRGDSIMHKKTIKNEVDLLDAAIGKFSYCKENKPHLYDEFRYHYYHFLIYPYIKIKNSKKIDKKVKQQYKQQLKDIREKKKVKFNFKVNMFLYFPRIIYFLYSLKNGRVK